MRKDAVQNLIVTGVGGQGNVLASRLLASAAVQAGWGVAVGETFGASQRGGSVMSHVRFFRGLARGPLIPRGQADIILGLEPLESLRVLLDYGNPATRVLMNDRPQRPIGCLTGEQSYPSLAAIQEAVAGLCGAPLVLAASQAALELGQPKAANLVMVGALAAVGRVPFGMEALAQCLPSLVRPDLLEANLAALQKGWEMAAA
jgi:indolepyruvate ferredoxin oxidoreductase, beta subunit